MVQDFGRQWSLPILIYEDDDAEVYTPDITSAGWRDVYLHILQERSPVSSDAYPSAA
jgi:hypothetical protein